MADTSNRDQLDNFYDRLQTLPALIRNLGLSIAEGQRAMDQNYIESLAAFTKIISFIKNNVAADAVEIATKANDAVADASKKATAAEAAETVKKAAQSVSVKSSDGNAVLEAIKGVTVAAEKPEAAAQKVADAGTKKLAELAASNGPSQAQYLELFRAIAPSHYQFTETAVEVRADLRVASASELTLGGSVGIKSGIFSVAVNFSYLKRSASDYQASAALRTVINAIPADHTMMNDLFARAGTPITAPFKADASFKAVLEALNEVKQLPAAPATPTPTPPANPNPNPNPTPASTPTPPNS